MARVAQETGVSFVIGTPEMTPAVNIRRQRIAIRLPSQVAPEEGASTKSLPTDSPSALQCGTPIFPPYGELAKRASEGMFQEVSAAELVGKLRYTGHCLHHVINASDQISEQEKITSVKNLLDLESKLDHIKNSLIKSMLIESLITRIKEHSIERRGFNDCQKTIVAIEKVMKELCDGQWGISQVKILLSKHDLPYNLGRRWFIRWHLDELEKEQRQLPMTIQNERDMVVNFEFAKAVEEVVREIRGDEELNDLEPLLSNIEKQASYCWGRLEELDAESMLGEYLGSLKQQYGYESKSGEITVLHNPAANHRHANEDAFKQTHFVTVVADGVGGGVCSDGASRLVVMFLSDYMEEIAKKERGRDINPEDIYIKLMECLDTVAETIEKDLIALSASTTAVVELRIPDREQRIHRFIVFVGDCNVLLTRPKDKGVALYLNPWEYAHFKKNAQPMSTYKCITRDGCVRIPTLEVSDIERISDAKGEEQRDVQNPGGTFSKKSEESLFWTGGLSIVYVKPGEGDTALLSDGISDRMPAEKLSSKAMQKVMVTESIINRYVHSTTFGKLRQWMIEDVLQTFKELIMKSEVYNSKDIEEKIDERLQESEGMYLPEEIEGIKLLINKAQYWGGRKEEIRGDVIQLIETLKWPCTKPVIDGMITFLWECYGENSPKIVDLSSTIAMDEFGLSEMHYESVLKWMDDMTYVKTNLQISCESGDLYSSTSLPLLTRRLVNKVWSTEEDLMSLFMWITVKYKDACTEVTQKQQNIEQLSNHVRCRLRQAMERHSQVRSIVNKAWYGCDDCKELGHLLDEIGFNPQPYKRRPSI